MFRIVLAILLLSSAGFAQDRPRRPAAIEAVLDLARSTPAEFQADAVFRLIESSKITEPKWKRELLDELFVVAGRARHPFPRRDVVAVHTDTDASRTESAGNFRLDALSIRCRVIQKMLALDARRARDLLLEMTQPGIPSLRCTDAVVPDPSVFYETAGQVLEHAFTSQEKKREEHILFLRSRLASAASSLEIVPAAQLLADVRVSPDQRRDLLSAFQTSLASLSDNDRAFSYAMRRLPEQMERLVATAKRDGLPVAGLIQAYRTYLVKHLSGSRCADTVQREKRWAFLSDYVKAFEEKLRPLADPGVQPIAPEEQRPLKVEGEPDPGEHWKAPQARALLDDFRRLPREDKPRLEHELPLLETYAESRAYLSKVETWQGEDESPSAYFHEKCALLHGMVGMWPTGRLQENAVRAYLNFLSQSPLEREEPAVWLSWLNALLRYARKMTPAEREELEIAQKKGIKIPGLPIENGAVILGEMRAANDPVIALYANLEGLAPKSLGSWSSPQ